MAEILGLPTETIKYILTYSEDEYKLFSTYHLGLKFKHLNV